VNKLYKKILSLSFGCLIAAESYAAAPDWPFGAPFMDIPPIAPNPPEYQRTPRRRWTEAEDQLLRNLVAQYGAGNWDQIALFMPNRNTRQCRERWMLYLNPNINNGHWIKEKDVR
jgi:hypothetical protein